MDVPEGVEGSGGDGVTIEDVRKAIAEIEACGGDFECAHSAEDTLHQRVLRAVANGEPNCRELAAEALKTLDLQFERWCA